MTQRPRRARGIYLLPNLFTTAALFAGFYAILAAIGGQFESAAQAIFVAMVLDGIDGRVARLTNTQSDFGAEYDSLSDLIAFGLAPSLLAYEWILASFGKVGFMAAFLYTACTALRLARFNTQSGIADKRFFQGLPSPAAAATVAGFVWVSRQYDWTNHPGYAVLCLLIITACALLMVSKFRYRSFKDFDARGRVPFMTLLLMVLAFGFISLEPALMLFSCLAFYVAFGPVDTVVQLNRRRRQRRGAPPA